MKLSFSTRGWPKLSWEEMLETALDMGFSGVEVYNLPKFDPMLEKGGPFHKYQSAATVRQLREKKLAELERQKQSGLIDQKEYEQRRKELVGQ